MNKLTNSFNKVIKEAYSLVGGITDVKDKAMALAAIAQAIASTGAVEAADIEDVDGAKEEVKKDTAKKGASTNAKKDALKPEAGKGKTTPAPKEEKEEIAPVEDPTPAEETTPEETEVEIEEEWSEAMTELKAAELERLQGYVEAWTDEYVYGDCVAAFFESSEVTGADNIRPTNIDGFLTYLDQLAEQFAAQE